MKAFLGSLVAAAAFALAAAPAQSRPFEQIRAGGKIRAATEGQFAPFNFFVAGTLSGFEVELGEAIAKKMGLAIEWKALPFEDLFPALAKDQVDVLVASTAVTEERSRTVAFAAPHYCSGGMIVSRRHDLKTVKDLAGKALGAQAGTTYYKEAVKLGTARSVRDFNSDNDARGALVAGRIEAWVTDRFSALEAAKKYPQQKLHTGELLFVERIAAAAGKGNAALVDAWNTALAATLADGTYAALSQKYFGEDIRCR